MGAQHNEVRTFLLGQLDDHIVGLAGPRHPFDFESIADQLRRRARHRLPSFLLPLFAVTVPAEPLQKFRLSARGHGAIKAPETHRARIEQYFGPVPFWYPPFDWRASVGLG